MVFNPDNPKEHEEEKHKDNHIYKNILEEWFEKRFGRKPSVDEGYFKEWKERFNSNRFESCMDGKSKRIWLEVVRERLMRGDTPCLRCVLDGEKIDCKGIPIKEEELDDSFFTMPDPNSEEGRYA